MARTEASLPVLALRFGVPLIVLALYWWIRLPDLTSPTADANIGWEWFGAIVATLIGIAAMLSAVLRIYQRVSRP